MTVLDFTPDVCFYHSPCLDGTVAAAVVARRFPQCALRPINYAQWLPDDSFSGKNVLMVDFCPRSVKDVEAIAVKASRLLILDHHPQRMAHRSLVVDQTRCGSSLVWDTLFPDRPRPWLVKFQHDYDLWLFEHPETVEIMSALSSYSLSDSRWRGWAEDDEGYCLRELLIEGRACRRAEIARVEAIKANFVRRQTFLGFVVPLVNVGSYDKVVINDIGAVLGKTDPFVVCWAEDSLGRYRYSLRSSSANVDAVDVGCIAQALGGGGHRNAAGVILSRRPTALADVNLYSEWASQWSHLSDADRLDAADAYYRRSFERT